MKMNQYLNKYLTEIGYEPVELNDNVLIYKKGTDLVSLNKQGEIRAAYPGIKNIYIKRDNYDGFNSITVSWHDGTETTSQYPEAIDEMAGFAYAIARKFIGGSDVMLKYLMDENITKRAPHE